MRTRNMIVFVFVPFVVHVLCFVMFCHSYFSSFFVSSFSFLLICSVFLFFHAFSCFFSVETDWASKVQHVTPQCRSKFRHHLLRDVNASAVLFVPGSRRCRLGRNLRVHHRKISGRCSRVGINLHSSILQTPRISEYSQQHFTVPAFLYFSSPTTAACHHHCIVAHDVFSRSRVETGAIQFTASFCCGPAI